MSEQERRFQSGKLSLRSEGGQKFLQGHAAVYNSWSQDLGGFREKLSAGCFGLPLLEGQDVCCLFNHDSNGLLGRTSSGTLKVWSDERGLAFRVSLPNTQLGRDLGEMVSRGDVNGCSFGFTCATDGDDWGEDEENGVRFVSRIIRKISRLYDASPVVSPAYLGTDVSSLAPGFSPGNGGNMSSIPQSVLQEARARNARAGRIVPPVTAPKPTYRRMTDEEVLEAARESRDEKYIEAVATHNRPHSTPTPVDLFIAEQRRKDGK